MVEKLTLPQANLLRLCGDGKPHSTGPATGGVARALENRGLVTVSYRLGSEVVITAKGREVLAMLEGNGRQLVIGESGRRVRHHPQVTCPVCHHGTRTRLPPSKPELFAHRDSDGKLCQAAGETMEGAKVVALEIRIAGRLRAGDDPAAIAEAEGVTPGRVAAVQTKIDEGRR